MAETSERFFPDWIKSYLEYTSSQESPERFHTWSALSAISSALARKVFMYRGHYTLFPNQYVVLVSESARCRKTTAANIAVNMLKRTGADMLVEKLTMQYLSKHLCEIAKKNGTGDSNISIYSPELSNFLGSDAYNSGLISMLTSVYDCPETWEYRTKNAGIDILKNVCVNILGCTTMEWMSQHLPGDTVEGGFTGRVIFVVSDEPKCRNAWPELSQDELIMKDRLIHDLTQIAKLRGVYTVTPEAKEFYTKWYETVKDPEDARLKPYYGRKGDHVLKVAIAFAASNGDELLLTKEHIVLALNALMDVEQLMPHAFRGVAYSKTSKDADRILRHIEKAKRPVLHSALLKQNYVYLNAKEFAEVMHTLIEGDMIDKKQIGRKMMYKLKDGEW
jgi:hypothetical protein